MGFVVLQTAWAGLMVVVVVLKDTRLKACQADSSYSVLLVVARERDPFCLFVQVVDRDNQRVR